MKLMKTVLLGNTNANTAIAVNPYPEVDYQRWYKWWGTGDPVLPAEPVGIRIWMEPECATVGSDWQIVTDTAASNGKYVVVNGLNSTAAAPAGATGSIVLPFTIDSAATYNVMARLNCPSANDDSYWIKFDNGAFVTVNNLTTSGWMWMRLTNANLTVGQHTLTIAYREDGARLGSPAQTVTVTIPDKIKICHNGNGITTSKLAALAHLRHGDCLGACAPGPDYPALNVTGNPNPSYSSFLITIKNGHPAQPVSLKVYNALGGFVEQRQNLQVGQSFRVGQNYRLGLYYFEFTQGLDKEVLLLLKL